MLGAAFPWRRPADGESQRHLSAWFERVDQYRRGVEARPSKERAVSAAGGDRRVLVIGASAMGNVGDDLLAGVLTEMLAAEGADVHLAGPDIDPLRVAAYDAVVVGGGGLVYASRNGLERDAERRELSEVRADRSALRRAGGAHRRRRPGSCRRRRARPADQAIRRGSARAVRSRHGPRRAIGRLSRAAWRSGDPKSDPICCSAGATALAAPSSRRPCSPAASRSRASSSVSARSPTAVPRVARLRRAPRTPTSTCS